MTPCRRVPEEDAAAFGAQSEDRVFKRKRNAVYPLRKWHGSFMLARITVIDMHHGFVGLRSEDVG